MKKPQNEKVRFVVYDERDGRIIRTGLVSRCDVQKQPYWEHEAVIEGHVPHDKFFSLRVNPTTRGIEVKQGR